MSQKKADQVIGMNSFREQAEELLRCLDWVGVNTPPEARWLVVEALTAAYIQSKQCRYCSEPLCADGDGGWTCAKRFQHDPPSIDWQERARAAELKQRSGEA